MDSFEIRDALATFRIIVDTREQRTPKAAERYKSFGVPFEQATLNYGDYCANITMTDGSNLHDTSKRITPKCVIERKMNLDELAGCFTRSRDRFRREFERATEAGAVVYLLVENATYEALIGHRYRSRFHPEAFLASLTAWEVRYGLRVVFCKSGTSGRVIREILYRDIKERLERGEYG
jgi:ERCC4-type nuclease